MLLKPKESLRPFLEVQPVMEQQKQRRWGEALITPDTVKAKGRGYGDVAEEVGKSTAIGVATDVALPPIGRLPVELPRKPLNVLLLRGGISGKLLMKCFRDFRSTFCKNLSTP